MSNCGREAPELEHAWELEVEAGGERGQDASVGFGMCNKYMRVEAEGAGGQRLL